MISRVQGLHRVGKDAFHICYRFHLGLRTKKSKTACGIKIRKPVFYLPGNCDLRVPTAGPLPDMCEACWNISGCLNCSISS